jgi:hypothetical protein
MGGVEIYKEKHLFFLFLGVARNQWLTIIMTATGDHGWRPAEAKKFVRPHLNGKKLGMVAHACHPSDGGKH